jgi:hypothetical protein
MKPDLYTKAVLAVIALMLAVIACKPLINPETTASAQGPFAGVQFTGGVLGFSVYDTRTGDFWGYDNEREGSNYVLRLKTSGRLPKLGAQVIPLATYR